MPNIKISLLIIFLVFGFLFAEEVRAGVGDNVSGWAWSENIGWISFNCTNGGTCLTVDYGVNIDSGTGIFSGYAWSENIGWISFNVGELAGCPTSPCQAILDFGTKEVSGWAKALTDGGGWDGWIRLRDTNYGVSWNSATGEMEGYAWSDMVIGWISFNCNNEGVCATSNYKVVAMSDSTPPTISVTGAPATWQNTDACAAINCVDGETGCDNASYRFISYSSDPGSCPTDYSQYFPPSPDAVCAANEEKISSHLWVCGTARDLAGNPGFSTPVEFLVDKSSPSSAVTNPVGGSWHNDDFNVTLDDSDTGGSGLTANCEYLIVGLNPVGADCSSGVLSRTCDPVVKNIPVGSGACTASNICIFEGTNRCKVNTRSYDNAGNNSGWVSEDFSVDFTNPTVGAISCTTPPNTCTPNATCTTAEQGLEKNFCASLKDEIGRIVSCGFYEDGVSVSAAITVEEIVGDGIGDDVLPCENGEVCKVTAVYAPPNPGNHGYRFACQDAAGNIGWGEEVTVSVAVNNLPQITAGPSYTTSPCTQPTTQPSCQVNFITTVKDDDGDVLTYIWDFGDGTSADPAATGPPYPTDITASHHYDIANIYTVIVTISDGRGGIATSSVNVTVIDPSLNVSLCAGLDANALCTNPYSGTAPLNGLDLKATVSGTAYGTITYAFDCDISGITGGGDCTADYGTPGWSNDCDHATTSNSDSYTIVDLCNYLAADIYTAKTLTERGTETAEDTVVITVSANQPPTAAISCCPDGCTNPAGICTGYTQTFFCLRNDSSDINGIDDIVNSIWTIRENSTIIDTSDCSLSGNPICNWTLPSTLTSGNYVAELYAEDFQGLFDTTTQAFTIRQDAIADFKCSFDNSTWRECGVIYPHVDEVVYFLDQSSPSEGASITNRSWIFPDGNPASNIDNDTNPFTQFQSAGSKQVSLTITDSAGRNDSRAYIISVELPLPEWREIPPF